MQQRNAWRTITRLAWGAAAIVGVIGAALGWAATSEVLTLAAIAWVVAIVVAAGYLHSRNVPLRSAPRPLRQRDMFTVIAVALVGGGLAGLVFVLVMAVALSLELPFGLGLAMLCVAGALASELVSGAIARIARTSGDPAPSGPRVG